MDSAELNDWMQVIGIFAVVASLIFVGLQMRQDQEIAMSLASQARTDTTIQSLAATASNPFCMSAVDKMANDEIELLLPSEKRAVAMYGVQLIMIFENIHIQYLNGFVGEERWAGAKESLKTAGRGGANYI